MSESTSLPSLAAVIETVRRLRAPGGCPWDRAQTHQSLRPYLIEEAYEVLDCLDRVESAEDLKKDEVRLPLQEELGDLLMQVLLHSAMTQEAGAFDIHDVAQGLNEKLIRRHPHVFGEAKVDSADSALASWEKQKAKEKAANPEASALDGLPKGMPALQRAEKVIGKVTKVGFQWPDLQGPLAKMEEELGELKAEIAAGAPAERIAAELGDLLFSVCNVASFLKIQPEDALRAQLRRFETRFRHVERRVRESGKEPGQAPLEEMDRYWDEAKTLEKKA